VIGDTRPAARSAVTVLSDLDRLLYKQCDAVIDIRRLVDVARVEGYATASEDSIAQRLGRLCDAGLMLRDGRRYLALAVSAETFRPTRTAARALRAAAAREQVDASAVQDLLVTTVGGRQ
jgi:hypothetical protein